MKKIIYLMVVCFLAGCISFNSPKSVPAGSTATDRRAAFELAKKQLGYSEHKDEYTIYFPSIIADEYTAAYPDYWFVSFNAREYEKGFWRYLVVIHKTSRDVVFAGPHAEQRIGYYDWVFGKK